MPKRMRGGKKTVFDRINPYLPELHYRGFDTGFKKYSFAGPGTDLKKRLKPDRTPHEWSKPVNRVDQAAYKHDLAYDDNTEGPKRKQADNEMIDSLKAVRKDKKGRWQERADAGIVEGAMRAKRFAGIGKARKGKNIPGWLQKKIWGQRKKR